MLKAIDEGMRGINTGFDRLNRAAGRIARDGAEGDLAGNFVEVDESPPRSASQRGRGPYRRRDDSDADRYPRLITQPITLRGCKVRRCEVRRCEGAKVRGSLPAEAAEQRREKLLTTALLSLIVAGCGGAKDSPSSPSAPTDTPSTPSTPSTGVALNDDFSGRALFPATTGGTRTSAARRSTASRTRSSTTSAERVRSTRTSVHHRTAFRTSASAADRRACR